MAEPRIKATYTLDVETVRDLERMAKKLGISKSAALRRAIRLAAAQELSPAEDRIRALDELQASVARSGVDIENWAREAEELRKHGYQL